jgi:hypothetical protein
MTLRLCAGLLAHAEQLRQGALFFGYFLLSRQKKVTNRMIETRKQTSNPKPQTLNSKPYTPNLNPKQQKNS